jgi:transcriptional regulator with PAS, ATPase and Fis domain
MKKFNRDRMQNSLYIKLKSGEEKVVFMHANVISSKDGNNFTIVSVSDISEEISCHFLEIGTRAETENGFYNIIGKDRKMRDIYSLIKAAADSQVNVLITGETGSGKEIIARAIHDLSTRRKMPFVAVNCSSLTETLLESELFGHVKGSFTGAIKDKMGKFEQAGGGTIFLDEIGEISPYIQVKLLRVIQEKIIQKVGDNHDIQIDMRIMAATNKDLTSLMQIGEFREDLYYRLKVFNIHTVPLREHITDLPLLLEYFIHRFNRMTGKNIKGLSNEARRLLMEHPWPGNVRELENSIEHAFVLCNQDEIDIMDLPSEIRNIDNLSPLVTPSFVAKQKRASIRVKMSKKELIHLLNQYQWNRQKTAEALGISRVALWKKMKRLNIHS